MPNRDANIEHILQSGQLVGLSVQGQDFVAEVLVETGEGYKVYITKIEEKGYMRDYDVLLSNKQVTAYKGVQHQNSSVKCDVIEAKDAGDGVELHLSVASSVTVAQLRNFVRRDISLPVQVTGTDPRTGFFGPPIKTQTLDISAGGLRCLCPALYEIKSEVNIELLGTTGSMIAEGIVLRRRVQSDVNYDYGILFNELDEKNRDLMEQFCSVED